MTVVWHRAVVSKLTHLQEAPMKGFVLHCSL